MSPFVVLVSLSAKQTQCISLLASGLSQKEACKEIKVSPRTAQRWNQDPEFAEALETSIALAKQETTQETAKSTAKIMTGIWENRDLLREKELSLLDKLQQILMDCLEGDTPDYRAVDRLIKLSQARTQLLGLNLKSYPILDALQLLVTEQVATHRHAEIVRNNLLNMENELREFAVISTNVTN